MRAHCESCGKAQPVDWRAGDLCVHCGLAVRQEGRCHWCVKRGPRAKFCRSCGAAAVAREQFGAARILKNMGASVFEIPKYLAEMEPEQIATYDSMYGVQAAAANRHIE
jgi:primosomal protein N'